MCTLIFKKKSVSSNFNEIEISFQMKMLEPFSLWCSLLRHTLPCPGKMDSLPLLIYWLHYISPYISLLLKSYVSEVLNWLSYTEPLKSKICPKNTYHSSVWSALPMPKASQGEKIHCTVRIAEFLPWEICSATQQVIYLHNNEIIAITIVFSAYAINEYRFFRMKSVIFENTRTLLFP